jgi:xanthine dehydrogenase YagS FAD-binding subunit
MRPFDYQRPTAISAALSAAAVSSAASTASPVQYLGGGTTLLDLMKLDVMHPETVIDITGIEGRALRSISQSAKGLRIGALVPMAELAEHKSVARDYPVLTQSLWLAASAQLRNMARLGGNVLQRTRCSYFRDTSYTQCNKRVPGSGCAARDGFNRLHAVLGTSEACIAMYPGDWAQALIALDAVVEVAGANGPRSFRFADLHKLPGDTPHLETSLSPGELITGFTVPSGPWRRSLYRKVRDRESYAFANASAAVALDMDGQTVRDVRIALGGVATIPWRATKAEAILRGKAFTPELAREAAKTEFAGATALAHNAFKIPLGQGVMVRALTEAHAMEV